MSGEEFFRKGRLLRRTAESRKNLKMGDVVISIGLHRGDWKVLTKNGERVGGLSPYYFEEVPIFLSGDIDGK
jgi:hypothetical protein